MLCEGDPFFYGSFMYLYARLAGRCPVVVPGVSSLMACAGAAGAARRAQRRLTVHPGAVAGGGAAPRLGQCEAAAIIKVGRHLAQVRAVLEDLGLTDRARYVERATLARSGCCRCATQPRATHPISR